MKAYYILALILLVVVFLYLSPCSGSKDRFTAYDLKNLPPPPTGRVRPPSPNIPLPAAPANLNMNSSSTGPGLPLCQQAIELLPVISSDQRMNEANVWVMSALNGWCNNAQTRRWQAEALGFQLSLSESIRNLYEGQTDPNGLFHNKQNVCAAARVISTPPTGAEQYWNWYYAYWAGYSTDVDAQKKLAEMLDAPVCEFTNEDFA